MGGAPPGKMSGLRAPFAPGGGWPSPGRPGQSRRLRLRRPCPIRSGVMPHVLINDVYFFPETVRELEAQLGLRLPPGRYWYDRRSGLAGLEKQGASAILPAGLDLGGP